MKATLTFAMLLAVVALLAPLAIGPRQALPNLLRWIVTVAPWLLAAVAGWTLVAVWLLRRAAELFLRTPGRRLDHTSRA